MIFLLMTNKNYKIRGESLKEKKSKEKSFYFFYVNIRTKKNEENNRNFQEK